MSSFQGRRQPESWEQAASKLLDERWLEVFHYKVKSKDAYLESKKRLSKGASANRAVQQIHKELCRK